MPRAARIVISVVPHHATQRGDNHQDVFFTSYDRRVYLEMPRERSVAAGVTPTFLSRRPHGRPRHPYLPVFHQEKTVVEGGDKWPPYDKGTPISDPPW